MNSKRSVLKLSLILSALISGCGPKLPPTYRVPAEEYVKGINDNGKGPTHLESLSGINSAQLKQPTNPKASLTFVTDGSSEPQIIGEPPNTYSEIYPAERQIGVVPYKGPLTVGEPGQVASLWKENRLDTDMYRDFRAWRPMDIITIVISERTEGIKEADTELRSTSTVEAAINNLFKINEFESGANMPWVGATTRNDFIGEGDTSRRGELRGRISAMVVEVLPSGILRISGEKIVSVNSEEEIMVLSGLVRQRDINSNNEIESSRIANMRVDFFGRGIVGEAQSGGWLGRLMRVLWPF